jgi:hypothetical protein
MKRHERVEEARMHEGTKGGRGTNAQTHECRVGVCPPLTDESTIAGAKNFSPLTETAKTQRIENAKPRRGDICITINKRSAAYGSRGGSKEKQR